MLFTSLLPIILLEKIAEPVPERTFKVEYCPKVEVPIWFIEPTVLYEKLIEPEPADLCTIAILFVIPVLLSIKVKLPVPEVDPIVFPLPIVPISKFAFDKFEEIIINAKAGVEKLEFVVVSNDIF